jgi:hypothetical protein
VFGDIGTSPVLIRPPLRDRKFADSLLEEAVWSELVSFENSLLAGKIQGI